MPWEIKKSDQCPTDKPWGVFNKQTGRKVACHATKASAREQQKALYVNVPESRMNSEESVKNILVPVKQFSEGTLPLDSDGLFWLQAYPYKSWTHPVFTDTTVDPNIAQQFVKNFNERVYGQDLSTDYEHGLDPAKGAKASGWVRKVEARGDGLWYGVEFTQTALDEIAAGEWKYFSAEHYDNWKDPVTQEVHQFVLSGGGLTNKPYVKGMIPLNFSEIMVEREVTDLADPTSEHRDMEHSEPGTGSPPEPHIEPIEKDAETGSRRDSPPAAFEPEDMGGNVDELDKQIREVLGLAEDADIVKAVTALNTEVAPLREAAKAHSERKAFSEAFPDEFKRLEKLEEESRVNAAKRFSEQFSRFTKKDGDKEVKDSRGYSALALEKIETFAKSFSERTATLSDLAEILHMLPHSIVDFGESGTSRYAGTAGDASVIRSGGDARKAFSELAREIAEKDKLEWDDAVKQAAKTDPQLFEAYLNDVQHVASNS